MDLAANTNMAYKQAAIAQRKEGTKAWREERQAGK